MENYMETLAKRAKAASVKAARIGGTQRDRGLRAAAEELLLQKKHILEENEKDMKTAREKGIKQSLLDRLQLNEKRIEDMAEGLRQVSALESPVGEVLSMKNRPNGLRIGEKRVPIGVVLRVSTECDGRRVRSVF